jgi:hypothetical protein
VCAGASAKASANVNASATWTWTWYTDVVMDMATETDITSICEITKARNSTELAVALPKQKRQKDLRCWRLDVLAPWCPPLGWG